MLGSAEGAAAKQAGSMAARTLDCDLSGKTLEMAQGNQSISLNISEYCYDGDAPNSFRNIAGNMLNEIESQIDKNLDLDLECADLVTVLERIYEGRGFIINSILNWISKKLFGKELPDGVEIMVIIAIYALTPTSLPVPLVSCLLC